MIIGIFHPVINCCGGAEWVALNIINALKENGHKVILLTDALVDQAKFVSIFNRRVIVDKQIVFSLAVFNPCDYHNVYTNVIRSLLLKHNCEVLVDTYSNSVLPGMDISYVHYPMLKAVEAELPYIRNKIFFYPYEQFLNFSRKRISNRLFFANSGFTAEAVKAEFYVNPHVLYPPVSNDILKQNKLELNKERPNAVVTIGRIAHDKNLELIPYIAKRTRKNISFTIAGLLDSKETLDSLMALIKKLGVTDKVRVLPDVERHSLRTILLNSKVYLHPKINEHFGISIIEAMSSGCFPIVHNSGGAKEFVPKHLRYESIEEAAQMVDEAMETWSQQKAGEISDYAHKFSESSFSKQFIDIFNLHYN